MNRLRLRWSARPSRPTLCGALAAAALLAVLSGCSTAPPTRLHSLLASPAQAPALGAVPTPLMPPLVAQVVAQVVAVRVPLAVDQAPWLVRLPDQSLRVLAQERWTSPLRDELRAALREQLVRHWGLQEPAPGHAGAAAWRIELEVQRFESLPGQSAWLGGQFSLWAAAAPGQAQRTGLACNFSLQQPVADGPLALAEGHRQALARLAALIGQGLQELAAGRPARCAA